MQTYFSRVIGIHLTSHKDQYPHEPNKTKKGKNIFLEKKVK